MPWQRLDGLKARRLAAGLSITALARRANVSDQTINQLENGGTCEPEVTQRLVDAFGGPPTAITSSSIANPTVITVASHPFVSGDTVVIAGHTGSTPAVDGTRVVTVVNATSFTVPVNVTTGGTGGTATLTRASLGFAQL